MAKRTSSCVVISALTIIIAFAVHAAGREGRDGKPADAHASVGGRIATLFAEVERLRVEFDVKRDFYQERLREFLEKPTYRVSTLGLSSYDDDASTKFDKRARDALTQFADENRVSTEENKAIEGGLTPCGDGRAKALNNISSIDYERGVAAVKAEVDELGRRRLEAIAYVYKRKQLDLADAEKEYNGRFK